MTIPLPKQKFHESEKGELLRKELLRMVKSPDYNTKPVYTTFISDKYQFVEKHMIYMSRYPDMDHWQYILNVKLMTKISK